MTTTTKPDRPFGLYLTNGHTGTYHAPTLREAMAQAERETGARVQGGRSLDGGQPADPAALARFMGQHHVAPEPVPADLEWPDA